MDMWKLDNAINACNKMEQRADDFELERQDVNSVIVNVNGHKYNVSEWFK